MRRGVCSVCSGSGRGNGETFALRLSRRGPNELGFQATRHLMRTFGVAAFVAAGAGSLLLAVADRKDVRLDNNRFFPNIITARVGDTLAFVNSRGGPHNVQFADDSLSDQAHQLIDAAMPERPKVKWSRE